jgi:transcriptional regulator with XRE-family HTH domain
MEQDPVNPTRLVGVQVAKVRKSRGMTQEGLAEAMQAVGIDWQRVVVAKLEKGLRPFVKLDELLGLCVVLEISLVDLLVPADMTDQAYRVAPLATATAEHTREWIRGEEILWYSLESKDKDPGDIFAEPRSRTGIEAFVRWMPEERKRRVLQRWLDIEERDQWVMEHEDELREQWIAEREQKGTQS